MNKDMQTIELFDEDGNNIIFNVIAFFDMEDNEKEEKKEYVVVYEEGTSEDDAFALKIEKDEDGEDILVPVENEVELAAVQEAYNTIMVEE